MKDYLEHRQCTIKEVSTDELNRLIKGVVDLFDESWLNSGNENPICKLWKRQDVLSTNELINFAYAIDCIRKIDSKWLYGQIKRVKSKDINNTRGAIFEIMGFSYFYNDKCTIHLASEGNPGVDGTLCFNENVKMNISMKSYGPSRFEIDFKKRMAELKDYFVSELKKAKILTLQCVIQFEKYPNKDDLEKIKFAITEGIKQFRPPAFIVPVQNVANIVFGLIQNRNFALNYNSYIFLALSPLHKNEFKNIEDKLEDACSNLTKHGKIETNNEINGIFIHLHESVAINKCKEFLDKYLKDNQQKPISFILLYCPSVARDIQNHTSSIIHMVCPVCTQNYIQWKLRNNLIEPSLNFFVGEVSIEKPRQKLISDNMPHHSFDIEDMYIYQHGEIYEAAAYNDEGSQTGDLSSLAPGVQVITVSEFLGKECIIKGKFPEDEHLEII